MLQLNVKLRFIYFVLYFLWVLVSGNIVDSGKLQAQPLATTPQLATNTPEPENQKNKQTQNENNNKKTDSKAEQLFLEGVNCEYRKDTATAIKLYAESLSIVHRTELKFAILHRLAVLNAKMKNYTESERYFRIALADNNVNVNSTFLCDFAKLYIDRNRLQDAETILKNAILITPSDRRTLFNLGQVIAQQTDRQTEGLRYLKLALGDKLAYQELAKIYRKLGSENQAEFAEQQALLAKDETPKNNTTNNEPKEISTALREKIKQELMLLEAKETAAIQDKILTDQERQLLTNPNTTTQIPTTIPNQITTPTPTPPHTTVQPILVDSLIESQLATPNLPNSEQKNNDSLSIKLTPEVSNKFTPNNRTQNEQTPELRPIDFDKTTNTTENTTQTPSSQIRLIPYPKQSNNVTPEQNINLIKPENKIQSDVNLSFDLSNSDLRRNQNNTTNFVTKNIESEPSIKIREIDHQKDNKLLYRNHNNEYTKQQNTQPNINVTKNQYTQQNLNNDMSQSPNRSYRNYDFDRNKPLPKLEFIEAEKSDLPKSDTENALAFRLVTDKQPYHNINTNSRQTESPFPQNKKINIAPKIIDQQPMLVSRPAERIDNPKIQNNNIEDKTINLDKAIEIADTSHEPQTEQNTTTEKQHEISFNINAQTNNQNKIEIESQTNTINESTTETKINTKTEIATINENENENIIEGKIDVDTEVEVEVENKSSEPLQAFINDTPQTNELPTEKDDVVKIIPEAKTEISNNILKIIQLPAEQKTTDNTTRILPRNEPTTNSEFNDIKITKNTSEQKIEINE
ncbi:MAG: hypothetical protein LBH59_01490, partial [Planctomycetaceae bacterium]|nr:hypothetical protein [Planctomycetaceae bacterium]